MITIYPYCQHALCGKIPSIMCDYQKNMTTYLTKVSDGDINSNNRIADIAQ